jgi:hypothetical protein
MPACRTRTAQPVRSKAGSHESDTLHPPFPPQCLITRGLIPLLAEGSARATDTDTTDEILAAAIEHAKRQRYCAKGDSIVALHRIGNASVIKIIDIK